ncbi:PEGA domain protein [Candidatus Thiomargarita nelsonii]|uniref:PEGA domain protein n=1 Tax=Candidatus Thiomargarita nelsonii TaxID=1003181 RepID=A0A176RUW4_9GAMM|nr:PEGA domain protein [Candidatus Thiomargarita nelsonii]
MKKNLLPVHNEQGQTFSLVDGNIGAGGEGKIWAVHGQPDFVAKIYKKITPQHEPKLKAMLANPPVSAHIAWPVDLLYEQKRLVGFRMPYVRESDSIFKFYHPILRKKKYPYFELKHFYHIAYNLAVAVSKIHDKGHVIGDVNESNILVNSKTLVTIIDTDSFQIKGQQGNIYPSLVGKPEYTPPELQGVNFKSVNRTKEHDYFGLAVLIFQLLMDGIHPTDGIVTSQDSVGRDERIKRGFFPYQKNAVIKPRPTAPPFNQLHPEVQSAFIRCFVDGYRNPCQRPSAIEWQQVLQKASPSIQASPISVKRTSYRVKPQPKLSLFQWALIKRLISNRLDPIRLFIAVFVLFIALVIFWPSSSPNESPLNGELLPPSAKIEPPAAPSQPKIVPLTVRSNIDNNTVFINGKNAGSSPLDVKLPLGSYMVRVEKDGYFPFKGLIDLQQAQNLRVKLQPKPKQLIISSNINNATVSINRKNYGSTPVNVKLPPAFYTVQVLKDGYFPFEKQIYLQQAQNLRVKLRPIDVDTQNGPKYPVPSVAFTLTALKPVVSVAFAPDSQTLVSGGHTVKLWQISTGQPRDTLIQDKVVMSVSFSPDGHKLAWSSHNEIILWDVNTGQPLHTLTGHKNLVMSVSFSPDGHTLASASSDKTIKLWDVRTGQPLHTLTGHKDSVMSVSFSPDGRTLASGSRDQTIKLWEISRAKLLHTLIGHKKMVWSVAYTPDGRILASGSKDKTIKLWKVSSGKALHSLTGHKYGVRSISFSPDGRVLASGSNDNTIKLWAVSTGKRLHSLTGHKKGVLSVCFSPDGSRLASGSDDKTIKLWSSK